MNEQYQIARSFPRTCSLLKTFKTLLRMTDTTFLKQYELAMVNDENDMHHVGLVFISIKIIIIIILQIHQPSKTPYSNLSPVYDIPK